MSDGKMWQTFLAVVEEMFKKNKKLAYLMDTGGSFPGGKAVGN
jgi:hypothetical protein